VELLPDRQAATLEVWLKNHPGVQLISRDRAGEFARGAKQGAPEALQTADRFHVLRKSSRSRRESVWKASSSIESHSLGDEARRFCISEARVTCDQSVSDASNKREQCFWSAMKPFSSW
jgi:transposase